MEAVQALTDGLRRRARDALAAYLCVANRTPLPWGAGLFATAPIELSALLLTDVETGTAERASRIEEAISAVQTFVRRARLGLEPGWNVMPAFARFWDRQFASFDIWRACKARHLYKENWLEWTELDKARRSEAFCFLESRLEAGALSIAAPGGAEWWPQAPLPDHDDLELTERREPTDLTLPATPREGLGLLGTPERAARPSWLGALPPPPAATGHGAGGTIATASATPLWLQAAIRLGVTFVRLVAAGAPQAAHRFVPHPGGEGCVNCCAECGCRHEPCVDEYYFWLIRGRYFDNAPLPAGVQPSESNDSYEFGFQDDYYDARQQQSAYWQDPTQLPGLLAWDSQPMRVVGRPLGPRYAQRRAGQGAIAEPNHSACDCGQHQPRSDRRRGQRAGAGFWIGGVDCDCGQAGARSGRGDHGRDRRVCAGATRSYLTQLDVAADTGASARTRLAAVLPAPHALENKWQAYPPKHVAAAVAAVVAAVCRDWRDLYLQQPVETTNQVKLQSGRLEVVDWERRLDRARRGLQEVAPKAATSPDDCLGPVGANGAEVIAVAGGIHPRAGRRADPSANPAGRSADLRHRRHDPKHQVARFGHQALHGCDGRGAADLVAGQPVLFALRDLDRNWHRGVGVQVD
jgi:hypothetical protein